jgi:hypothetical protein
MATAMFWESIVKPEIDPDEVDDYNSSDVELEVAGHQFDDNVIHLWLDPSEQEGDVHSLTTIDMTIEEAQRLIELLQVEIANQQD